MSRTAKGRPSISVRGVGGWRSYHASGGQRRLQGDLCSSMDDESGRSHDERHLLDWQDGDRAIDIGYRYAIEKLEQLDKSSALRKTLTQMGSYV
jgi:hypothetical protein